VRYNLDTPKDFLDAYKKYNMEEKESMCEFYLHNIILPHPYKWNPNPYVWGVQIMALAYSLRHEEMRVDELKKYKEDVFQSPLWIRDEAIRL